LKCNGETGDSSFSAIQHTFSGIAGCRSVCEGTMFHIIEFVNVFGFVMMQWHSEAEPVLVPNSIHIVVAIQCS
jgi:hypothetical protein